MNLKDLTQDLLQDPEFRKEYFSHDLALEIANMLLEARFLKRMTQAELAEKIGSQQPNIARIEAGHIPTLPYLERIAHAFDSYLIPPKFAFMFETTSLLAKENSSIETIKASWPTPFGFLDYGVASTKTKELITTA